MRAPKFSTLAVAALALVCIALLPACVGTFESAADPETGEPARLGGAKGVVGKRTVVGVELPPVVLPVGVGFGFWIVTKSKTDEQLEIEDQEFIRSYSK